MTMLNVQYLLLLFLFRCWLSLGDRIQIFLVLLCRLSVRGVFLLARFWSRGRSLSCTTFFAMGTRWFLFLGFLCMLFSKFPLRCCGFGGYWRQFTSRISFWHYFLFSLTAERKWLTSRTLRKHIPESFTIFLTAHLAENLLTCLTSQNLFVCQISGDLSIIRPPNIWNIKTYRYRQWGRFDVSQ